MESYAAFPESLYQLAEKENSLLFESIRCDSENYHTYLFADPIAVLEVRFPEDIPRILKEIGAYRKRNCYAAGFLTYEAGYYCKDLSFPCSPLPYPLAWFGIYPEPIVYNHRQGKCEGAAKRLPTSGIPTGTENFSLHDVRFDIKQEEYREKIAAIKEYIACGDVYQINFSGKFRFNMDGSLLGLYQMLKKTQAVSYAAMLNAAGISVLSFSPELFFRINGRTITTRPMKGTAPRGAGADEDRVRKEMLQSSEKNRAENIMIVDVLRNDLGKISETGTVSVSDLLEVEAYETLFQMVSQIDGTLCENVDEYSLFKALFPGGSITGAPKRRAVEIIHELESGPRGIYTGAIGYFAPKKKAVFNIAIRTLVIKDGQGEMGSGGGIVWDSDADSEYQECLLKGDFLTKAPGTFELLETMLWDKEFFLLDEHLARLEASARHFGYVIRTDELRQRLQEAAKKFMLGEKYRVRITYNAWGETTIQFREIDAAQQDNVRVLVSSSRTDSHNPFLYHKTTRRNFYDTQHAEAVAKGFADVVFLNEKGEVTEGAISNIFIQKKGRLLTPPVKCGLLNGLYRQYMLRLNPHAAEAILSIDDLKAADEIFICNSVRGLRKVDLEFERKSSS